MKTKEDVLSLELLENMAGKFVTCPSNIIEGENNWFTGPVIGCGFYKIFNPDSDPEIIYNIVLADGNIRNLAPDCEINEITQEQFIQMVKDEYEKQKKAVEASEIRKKILGNI